MIKNSVETNKSFNKIVAIYTNTYFLNKSINALIQHNLWF